MFIWQLYGKCKILKSKRQFNVKFIFDSVNFIAFFFTNFGYWTHESCTSGLISMKRKLHQELQVCWLKLKSLDSYNQPHESEIFGKR